MGARIKLSAVVLLLLLAAIDLLVPGLCVAEASAPLTDIAATETPFGGDIDDCFCCCAHIVPEHTQTWDRAVAAEMLADQSPAQMTIAGVTPLYHPPRT